MFTALSCQTTYIYTEFNRHLTIVEFFLNRMQSFSAIAKQQGENHEKESINTMLGHLHTLRPFKRLRK
jgi:hypothetical protein